MESVVERDEADGRRGDVMIAEMFADLVNLSPTAWLVLMGCVALLGLYAYIGKGDRDG